MSNQGIVRIELGRSVLAGCVCVTPCGGDRDYPIISYTVPAAEVEQHPAVIEARRAGKPVIEVAEGVGGDRECAVCGELRAKRVDGLCEACRCRCCGQAPDCACELGVYDGDDRETGPYSEEVCFTHRCRV